jgi:hypothetical protein
VGLSADACFTLARSQLALSEVELAANDDTSMMTHCGADRPAEDRDERHKKGRWEGDGKALLDRRQGYQDLSTPASM